MKLKEIVIVEGKCDTLKMKQVLDVDTIETNGSAVSVQTIALIKHAQEKRGVIIFTDPDFQGDRIRKIISQQVPGCKHAFLPKKEALAKSANKSVGIEHASKAAIVKALNEVYEVMPDAESDITQQDLFDHKLIGGVGSKARREIVGRHLHIGYANGKQLLKRLHMFQINKSELNQAMQHILEGGEL